MQREACSEQREKRGERRGARGEAFRRQGFLFIDLAVLFCNAPPAFRVNHFYSSDDGFTLLS